MESATTCTKSNVRQPVYVIFPWQHAGATISVEADLDREQGQLAYSEVGDKHGKGRRCCKAGHQQ